MTIPLPTDVELERAAALLREGALVAFPTETVYGLGANALIDSAVAGIYTAKGRPQFNPLIIHVPDANAAARCVQWNARAQLLADAFWPGPLTLVLPRRAEGGISLLASAGMETLGVRAPNHPLAQALLKRAGVPLAAPSANRSGRVSPTQAAHVHEELGEKVALVLDGGPCTVGVESTVLDVTADVPTLLRHGAVTLEQIAGVLKCDVRVMDATNMENPASPGLSHSHYAPGLPVRLNALSVSADEALLAFGPHALKHAARTLNLSERGDVVEAAANLFAHLRALDMPQYRAIAVMPIPQEGLGIAINDRLTRAAVR